MDSTNPAIILILQGATRSFPRRARRLLTQSDLSAEAVAMATGFGSLSTFSRAYRDHFGPTARDERNLYRTRRSLDFLPPIHQSPVVDCRAVG